MFYCDFNKSGLCCFCEHDGKCILQATGETDSISKEVWDNITYPSASALKMELIKR